MSQQGSATVREAAVGTAAASSPPWGTNRFARWARTCGLLALVPFALVFGVIALVQVRRSGQRGKGAAITGLIAALVWPMVIYDVVDMFSDHVQRDPGGGVSAIQVTSVFDLRPGDCFTVQSRDAGGGIQWVVLVPCAQNHDGRVYATPVLAFNESLTAEDAAKAACTQALPAATPAGVSMGYLYPDELDFSEGHGQASCYTSS
ncbi:DUF4190 domain-containing protein [Kitasatospora sp. NBC_01266]|jgi:hypothetical protein|uniref:DUF4190 domain-containing protein n=1 Tax=Kitasatospora sp. NBC_01266 TaxID=2903572 RepID=UPI002E32F05A|nr:DUF4190 domain-containing protein [Kitasatospora sp. NBC_01266]